MKERPDGEMAAKLLVSAIERSGLPAKTLTDPVADTPMVVTLDQLRPYNLNPRITRNPLHDDIKASILRRGLDAPPSITRRPGETYFIIRNGGNTRLSILNELWLETKDEQFYRLKCLFRPWPGDLVLLTGHLVENELRGNLSFIERALAVAKANALYEAEGNTPLSQTELARRLTTDGYPISQSHISRMQDTVRFLLPAIPQILYGGLGKPQVERLATLRKQAFRVWENRSQENHPSVEFNTLFHDVLASFDSEPDAFTVQRAQDELVGQMAGFLSTDYDTLALEIADSDARRLVLNHDPSALSSLLTASPTSSVSPTVFSSGPAPARQPHTRPPAPGPTSLPTTATTKALQNPNFSSVAIDNAVRNDSSSTPADDLEADRIAQHVLSPIQVTNRLQSIQQTIAAATGDSLPDFRSNVLQAIPVQVGGLHPISDVWYIEKGLDAVERLRVHIAQLACEIAVEAASEDRIESLNSGIGFSVREAGHSSSPPSILQRPVMSLLSALSLPYLSSTARRSGGGQLMDELGTLLQGLPAKAQETDRLNRLSDVAIVKLFRLIRLARRLLELQSNRAASSS